jgi:hypothetical protein
MGSRERGNVAAASFRARSLRISGSFSKRTGALIFFLFDREVNLSSEELVAHHVIFIDTTLVKMILCTQIVNYGLIAQLLCKN